MSVNVYYVCTMSLRTALTMFNNLHQATKMGQNGTAHEDGDLLHNLDACVSSLPGLFAFTHSLEEGQQ